MEMVPRCEGLGTTRRTERRKARVQALDSSCHALKTYGTDATAKNALTQSVYTIFGPFLKTFFDYPTLLHATGVRAVSHLVLP